MSSATPATAIEAAFGDHIQLRDAAAVADALDQAAEANRTSPAHEGSVIELSAPGELIMSGDLHDHALNLQRILQYARLHEEPGRKLVLHEVVHGSSLVNGWDLSIRCLTRVAALKAAFPEQVLLLQSNHELAQANGDRILKGDVNVVETFDEGLSFLFGDDADQVREALRRYVYSLPLAIRCPNGVICAHSLPAPKHIDSFDKTVLDRQPTHEDLASGGSAYRMVWGRNHTQTLADELAIAWDCEQFILGHQPSETGYDTEGKTILILASDHEQGRLLPLDLSRTYSRDAMIEALMPLNSIA
jgi:hypothetical protein